MREREKMSTILLGQGTRRADERRYILGEYAAGFVAPKLVSYGVNIKAGRGGEEKIFEKRKRKTRNVNRKMARISPVPLRFTSRRP